MPFIYQVHSYDPELVLLVRGYGEISVPDIRRFDTYFKVYLYGKKPFKVFFDIRSLESTSMEVIKLLVKSMISFEELAPQKVLATSVLTGALIEKWINLLFKIREPITPTKVTSDLQEACDFLNS